MINCLRLKREKGSEDKQLEDRAAREITFINSKERAIAI